MRFANPVGEPAGSSADRFVSWVVDGRGDLARGRNLYLLRFLDALWEPSGPLSVPYRPTRNPAAFLAMTFDLVGDRWHGYLEALEGTPSSQAENAEQIRAHLRERLGAPWIEFVEELCNGGLPNLGRVVSETISFSLRRSAVSSLPTYIAQLPSLMTPEQLEEFDEDEFVRTLTVEEVFRFLTPKNELAGDSRASGREQHPTGGDLRAALRRRLDGAWRQAMAFNRIVPTASWHEILDAPLDFLASWPVDIGWLAAAADNTSYFAVEYALATDAPSPGRTWHAPPPYVTVEHRQEFESLTARDEDATLTRRATLLKRWGTSALLPSSVAFLDEQLEAGAELGVLHPGPDWTSAVDALSAPLEVSRRHFLQRVADYVDAAGPV